MDSIHLIWSTSGPKPPNTDAPRSFIDITQEVRQPKRQFEAVFSPSKVAWDNAIPQTKKVNNDEERHGRDQKGPACYVETCHR